MKKFFSVFMFAALLGLGACSDEEAFDATVDEMGQEFVRAWDAGQRLFVFDPWQDTVVIHFTKECEPLLETVENCFDWSIKRGEQLNSISLTVHDTVPQHPFLVKILLRNRDWASSLDSLYLVFRTKETPNVSLHAYQDLIGRTVNAGGSIFDTPKNQILSARRMFGSGQMSEIGINSSYGHSETEVGYEEMQNSMWEEVGASAFGGKNRKLFSGSFTQSYESSSIRSERYEFHYDMHVKSIVGWQLEDFVRNPYDNTSFLSYITDEAYLLLNKPDAPLYKKYPNTKEGIFQLYDDYGTHVLTGGIFGGRYTYLYGRKENYYMESVANSATAELSAKASATAAEGENWLQTYYRVMGDHKGALTGGGGDYNSEASEHMDERSFFLVSGGNASCDFAAWDASLEADNVNLDNLALVSFCNRDQAGGIVNKSAADNFVLPLHIFAYDQKRRAALLYYLDDYIESKYVPVEERAPLVVADFMMKNGVDGYDEKARSRVMKDAFGIERLYFPLVGNEYVPGDAPEGAMLETSSDHYIVVSDATDQIWWVALAYEDECTPIEHIAFLTKDENEELGNKYTLRGNRADHDMNYPEIDNHYVALKFINPSDTSTKPITGVGLTRKGNNGSFYVIASSPGTDMLKPYTTTEQKQFKKYWGEESHYKATKAPYEIGVAMGSLKDLDDGEKEDAWFGVTGAANSGNLILPAFTRKSLDYPLVFQKPRQFWNKEEDPDNFTTK